MRVDVLETPELGNRSYVVSDGGASVVVDPQRDLDRLEPLLSGVAPTTHVLETHVHNDYLSGGPALARATGAALGVNAADDVAFDRLPLHDGQRVRAGGLEVTVLATPGHTESHLAFHVRDRSGDNAVFTGGSLLFGTVGRTDLAGAGRTRDLTRAQYASAHRLATLPASTRVFPTHGFGSFCSTGGGSETGASTIADEFARNRVFRAASEQHFLDDLLGSFGDVPAYYASMGPANRAGVPPLDLSRAPAPVDADVVRAGIAAGGVVVDLRERGAYARGRLPGTLGVAMGAQFATYVGWLVPVGTPLTLIADDADALGDARRQLARIGFDDVRGAAAAVDEIGDVRPVELRSWDDLARDRRPDDVVLDIRRADERADGAVAGSVHVPLPELPGRLAGLPRRRTWVHCVSGFRAATAAGLLADAGIDVLAIDDHVDRAAALGLLTDPHDRPTTERDTNR